MLFTLTWKTAAYGAPVSEFYSPLTAVADTTIPVIDTNLIRLPPGITADTVILPRNDTTSFRRKDSSSRQKTDTFSLKISKDSLEVPLKYVAEDSVVILLQDKIIWLYGKTKIDYKTITLAAPKVELDQQAQVVTAFNTKDTSGGVTEVASFKDGDNEFTSDTIRYNFKTQVGVTQNTVTQDGEIFVHGEVAKKINENTTFIKNARFTTCNLDDPHFAFLTPRMKVINKKLAVSGPAHPEFEVDRRREKFMLTFNPYGYLRRK